MKKVSVKVQLRNVRGSYVHLADFNKHGYHSMAALIETGGEDHKQMSEAVERVFTEAFGEENIPKIKMFQMPLRDGTEESTQENYDGMTFFSANAKNRAPIIYDRSKKLAMPEDVLADAYSGAYFHISVNVYSFDATSVGGKKGVAVGLNSVIMTGKGDRIDNRPSADDSLSDFDDIKAESPISKMKSNDEEIETVNADSGFGAFS